MDIIKRVKAIYRDSFNLMLKHLPGVENDGQNDAVWKAVVEDLDVGLAQYKNDAIADELFVAAFNVLEQVWKEKYGTV